MIWGILLAGLALLWVLFRMPVRIVRSTKDHDWLVEFRKHTRQQNGLDQ